MDQGVEALQFPGIGFPMEPVFTVLSVAVILLFIFAVYMILGGAGRLYEKLKNHTSPRFLSDSSQKLLTWDARRAISDMSSELRRRSESSFFGGNWSHARGTVRSLTKRGGKWLAFTLNIRRGEGRLDLRSSSHMFSFEHTGAWEAFKADDRVFGYVDNEGRLFDAHQHQVGRVRYQRTLTPMGSDVNTTLDLGGRTIAEVNYLSDVGDRIWKAPKLVRDVSPSLTEDEAMWIMAVIAKGLYAHCRTSRVT
jgi:hypothetical protein